MTFTAVTAGMVLTWAGLPIPFGVLGAIGMGALTGLVSGLFITRFRIPPFIATLGMMLVLKGLSLIVTSNKPIYFNDSPGFTDIAQGSIVGRVLPFLPVPNGVVILFLVAGVIAWVLNRTVLGRYTYAIGSNEEAVRLSGVNVDGWKMAIYALAGAVTGVAGVLIAARVNSAQPALGQGYELEAIAAVVIGGTSLAGGRGTILGTLIGALIMSVLTNGLRILSVAPEWQIVATGVIIIGAVYADMLRKKA
jgi:ribose transport system permease protein